MHSHSINTSLRKDIRITLLMGGPGAEHDVSISSGNGILAALKQKGFTAITTLIVHDEEPQIPEGTELCYNIIHGTFGEDGGIQSYLEARSIPYTGTGVETSRNCFDKIITKQIMQKAGVPCPKDEYLTRAQILAGQQPSIAIPCVVKAPREGSSVGVYIVKQAEQLQNALNQVAAISEDILIEEYIQGQELTIGIIDGESFPIIEICPRSGFYDMCNKYPSLYKGEGCDYLCPAPFSEELTQLIQQTARDAYNALKVEVYGRVDILLDAHSKPYVLEINTIPGMTESSLLPMAAAAIGIDYAELCIRIAELSLQRDQCKSSILLPKTSHAKT